MRRVLAVVTLGSLVAVAVVLRAWEHSVAEVEGLEW